MNELTVLDYNSMPIRTIQKDDELWWVLTDVCRILEIANPRNVSARLDEDEKGVQEIDTLGGKQNVSIINEPGLYSLILRSNKPEARQFKRWVTHDVLPAIRRNGSYGEPETEQYDKMEIAKMIISCKSAKAVNAIMALFDVKPEVVAPLHIPQNSKNSVSLFLNEYTTNDIMSMPQQGVYQTYKNFCITKKLVPSTLANFSKELHKQTGLVAKRHRVNGILTGYYTF